MQRVIIYDPEKGSYIMSHTKLGAKFKKEREKSGWEGEPQCATIYCCPPKTQMRGVTFSLSLWKHGRVWCHPLYAYMGLILTKQSQKFPESQPKFWFTEIKLCYQKFLDFLEICLANQKIRLNFVGFCQKNWWVSIENSGSEIFLMAGLSPWPFEAWELASPK